MPSELELTRLYGVSRITSCQALDLLCCEGPLVSRQGMGSFIAQKLSQPLVRLADFVEDMAQAVLRSTSEVLHWEEEQPPPAMVSLLDVPSQAAVYRLDGLRLANGSPIALDWTWLPAQFGKLLAGEDLAHRTIYSILEQGYGVPIVSGDLTIMPLRHLSNLPGCA